MRRWKVWSRKRGTREGEVQEGEGRRRKAEREKMADADNGDSRRMRGAGRDEPGNKKRTTRRKGNEPQVIKKTDDSNCTTTIATITTKTTTTTTTNWTVITNTGGFLSSLCRFHNEKQVRCTATVYHLARVYLHYVPVY